MKPNKVIFLCGGDATRWGNFMNVKKQELVICGERIIDRLIRQFRIQDAEHYLVSAGVRARNVHMIQPSVAECNTDKFLSSHTIWQQPGPALLVYGDVFLFEHDARAVVAHSCGDMMRWFGNKRHGEMIAWYVPESAKAHAIERLRALRNMELSKLTMGGGWRACRLMLGLSAETSSRNWRDIMDEIPADGRFVNIEGNSRDFDYPHDLVSWLLPMAEQTIRRTESGPA